MAPARYENGEGAASAREVREVMSAHMRCAVYIPLRRYALFVATQCYAAGLRHSAIRAMLARVTIACTTPLMFDCHARYVVSR